MGVLSHVVWCPRFIVEMEQDEIKQEKQAVDVMKFTFFARFNGCSGCLSLGVSLDDLRERGAAHLALRRHRRAMVSVHRTIPVSACDMMIRQLQKQRAQDAAERAQDDDGSMIVEWEPVISLLIESTGPAPDPVLAIEPIRPAPTPAATTTTTEEIDEDDEYANDAYDVYDEAYEARVNHFDFIDSKTDLI